MEKSDWENIPGYEEARKKLFEARRNQAWGTDVYATDDPGIMEDTLEGVPGDPIVKDKRVELAKLVANSRLEVPDDLKEMAENYFSKKEGRHK